MCDSPNPHSELFHHFSFQEFPSRPSLISDGYDFFRVYSAFICSSRIIAFSLKNSVVPLHGGDIAQ